MPDHRPHPERQRDDDRHRRQRHTKLHRHRYQEKLEDGEVEGVESPTEPARRPSEPPAPHRLPQPMDLSLPVSQDHVAPRPS
jgi:hypothetical protein